MIMKSLLSVVAAPAIARTLVGAAVELHDAVGIIFKEYNLQ